MDGKYISESLKLGILSEVKLRIDVKAIVSGYIPETFLMLHSFMKNSLNFLKFTYFDETK